MENNIDLKSLWTKRTTPSPASDVMQQKIKAFQRQRKTYVAKMNICLTASSLIIIGVWIFMQPELLSTKLGIVVIIASMAMAMWFHNRSLLLYTNIDAAQNNTEYLERLMTISKRETFLQTTVLSTYYALLTTGLMLYLYEYATHMGTATAMLVYGLSFAWILVSWFYFRPRQIRKQRARLDEMLHNAQKINEQLQDNL